MDAVAESLQPTRSWGAGSVVRHWPSQHLMARAGRTFPLTNDGPGRPPTPVVCDRLES